MSETKTSLNRGNDSHLFPSLNSDVIACITSLTYNDTIEALRLLIESLNPGEPLQDSIGSLSGTSRQIIKEALYKYHMLSDDDLTLEKMINRIEYRALLPHYIVSCMIDYPNANPLLGLDYLRQMMYKSLFFSLDAGYVKATYSVVLETVAVQCFHNRTKTMYDRFCKLCKCKKARPYEYTGGDKIDIEKLLDISGFEDLNADADGYKVTCQVDNYLGEDILPDNND